MKRTLFASAVSAAAILAASAASATDYTITNVGFVGDTGVSVTGTINGAAFNSSEYTGIIPLTTSTGAILPVFCLDLFHNIYLGANTYQYTMGPLAFDSSTGAPGTSGNPLSQPVTGEIQTLANIGAHDYVTGVTNPDTYAALQGAIWELEYNTNGNNLTVGAGTPLAAAIAADIAYAEANPSSYANTIYPIAGVPQGPGGGQALTDAPGPNVGRGVLGFAAMLVLLIGVRYRGLFV